MRQVSPLLTLRDVERVTRRKTTTLRNDIRAGRLKVIRLGRQVRVEQAELIKFLTQGAQPKDAVVESERAFQDGV